MKEVRIIISEPKAIPFSELSDIDKLREYNNQQQFLIEELNIIKKVGPSGLIGCSVYCYLDIKKWLEDVKLSFENGKYRIYLEDYLNSEAKCKCGCKDFNHEDTALYIAKIICSKCESVYKRDLDGVTKGFFLTNDE